MRHFVSNRHRGSIAAFSRRGSIALVAACCGFVAARPALADDFTYSFYPTNTTINAPVTTDFAIVGYAGGSFNDDFSRNFAGPASPTITVASGAEIGDAEVFNSSVVNVTGGNVNPFLHDSSTLNVSGGDVSFCLSFSSAKLKVMAGTVEDIETQGLSLDISGGQLGVVIANSRTDDAGNSMGSSVAELTGGHYVGEINAYNEGILNLRGGTIDAGVTLSAMEGGTLNIYGTGLTAQLVDPNSTESYDLYTLAGSLANGSSIDGLQLKVRKDGFTYGHSTFNLINTPEPATLSIVGLAGVTARRRRRVIH